MQVGHFDSINTMLLVHAASQSVVIFIGENMWEFFFRVGGLQTEKCILKDMEHWVLSSIGYRVLTQLPTNIIMDDVEVYKY